MGLTTNQCDGEKNHAKRLRIKKADPKGSASAFNPIKDLGPLKLHFDQVQPADAVSDVLSN